MTITFKQYLTEEYPFVDLDKVAKLYITLGSREDVDGDDSVEVQLEVTYQLVEDVENHDGFDRAIYHIDEESIEYYVNENFKFHGKLYKKGTSLKNLYDNIFIEPSYVKDSDWLAQRVSGYFMKQNLNLKAKEEVLLHVLYLMIEDIES